MTVNMKETLMTMKALAADNTELSRVQLAGMLFDVFISQRAHIGAAEEKEINALIDQLMENAPYHIREEIARRFADAYRMPRRIAMKLIYDSKELAMPILKNVDNLDDKDLISIIKSDGIKEDKQQYAKAIAERKEISEAVVDALVTTGDVEVIEVIVNNLGAKLSPKAVVAITSIARYMEALQKPLLERREATTEVALKLFWWIEQDLRRYAISRFYLVSEQIESSLASTIKDFLNDHANEKDNDKVMEDLAKWIYDHKAITPKVLQQVLRMGYFGLFKKLFAKMAGLSLDVINGIIEEPGGRGFAAACKANKIDKAIFISLLLLSRGGRQGEQNVNPREVASALAVFDGLSIEKAAVLLASWKLNPSYFKKTAETKIVKM
ncbi:MAG: DUF2336 domain-containing protein [Alphaproteobacteria bacterium]|nr:DUF2336 domain-containing protein [Alphaproteobacteria bacterium]MCL2504924.1 DUF2336 domain-containing protein [Alphaproteobacteria bacterium]